MKKYFYSFMSVIFLLLGLMFQAWPDNNLHLVFCDVGQGDATLITLGFNQMLIDAGPGSGGTSSRGSTSTSSRGSTSTSSRGSTSGNSQVGAGVLACLDEHMPFWDRTIEVIVATHADQDHIGGFKAVLERFKVKNIIATPFDKPTQSFTQFKQALAQAIEAGAVLKSPFLGQQIGFSQVEKAKNQSSDSSPSLMTATVLASQVKLAVDDVEKLANAETTLSAVEQYFAHQLPTGKSDNDLSIVILLESGQLKALLTGDLDQKGELSLIETGLIKPINILKVGHHGSKTSTNLSLLQALKPEISVISVGKNNSYHHPSPEVLNILNDFDIEILRTDELGSVEFLANQQKYWLKK